MSYSRSQHPQLTALEFNYDASPVVNHKRLVATHLSLKITNRHNSWSKYLPWSSDVCVTNTPDYWCRRKVALTSITTDIEGYGQLRHSVNISGIWSVSLSLFPHPDPSTMHCFFCNEKTWCLAQPLPMFIWASSLLCCLHTVHICTGNFVNSLLMVAWPESDAGVLSATYHPWLTRVSHLQDQGTNRGQLFRCPSPHLCLLLPRSNSITPWPILIALI